MKNDIMNQLDAELAHAGEDTQLSPAMLLLEQLRITPEKQLPSMEFLFRLFGKPCFPRRELVAITGKAKSGKTFVTSMLMACCVLRSVLSFQRVSEQRLRVLWYDTEQSDESTQDILKNRVLRMVGESPECDIFNVRAVEWKQRRSLLTEAVRRYKPDLVIVDGIRDLVNDINDGVLAQEVMEKLLHLATASACCIVCVLHQNKSGEDRNLRGWIGTELMNKAFEVYQCEKMMPQRVFKVEQTLTRKYIVHDDATPCGWQFDVMRLFLDAMQGEDEVSGGVLRERVMRLSGIAIPFKYNKLLGEALEQKVIEKSVHDGRTVYRPAPF